jgi:Family of unknown function (DUF6515)
MKKLFSVSCFSFIVVILMFVLTANINAQQVKKEIIVKKNGNYKEIIVKNRHYFYREGYFYENGPKGYVKVVAPIDARITLLPMGYKVVRVHRVRYYLFDGVYYRYFPHEKVYVVVAAPR